MTISGFTIISCPFCPQQYQVTKYGSFNTFRATFYSDGYVEGGIPTIPEVIKCVNGECNGFFLLKDQPVLFDLDRGSSRSAEWDRAYSLAAYRISADDLEGALHAKFSEDPENERKVRQLLHLRVNDRFRKEVHLDLSPEEKSRYIRNIERLIEFSADEANAEGRLYLAELFREKGDFGGAMEILKSISSDKAHVTDLKEKIYSQCKRKDPLVFDIGAVAVKKEFCCEHCGEALILFDLDKMDSPLQYRHFVCLPEKKAFDAALRIKNPNDYYTTNIFQTIFLFKRPYQSFVRKPSIECPTCGSTQTKAFDPHKATCLKCGQGKYKAMVWF